MRVSFYRDTISSNKKKRRIIEAFAHGIRTCGDVFEEYTTIQNYTPTDFVLVLGAIPITVGEKERLKAFSTGTDSKKVCRDHIVKSQLENNQHTIVIESTLLGVNYYRVGIDHHLPNLANFMNRGCSPDRWSFIKQDQRIGMIPWRSKGKHILICLQRDGAFAIRDIDQMKWLRKTVKKLRKYSDRPIVIRAKDDMKRPWELAIRELQDTFSHITVSKEKSIESDASKAWAAVVIASTVDIKLSLLGIPVFTESPRAFSYQLGNNDFAQIESPIMGGRRNKMVHGLAYAQWNLPEMRSGMVWERIKKHYEHR